jgi:uncharacterized protein YyaL (SSP411 family)
VYAPRRWTIAIPSEIAALPAAIAAKVPGEGALAYICRGSVCAAPIDSLTTLLRELNIGAR